MDWRSEDSQSLMITGRLGQTWHHQALVALQRRLNGEQSDLLFLVDAPWLLRSSPKDYSTTVFGFKEVGVGQWRETFEVPVGLVHTALEVEIGAQFAFEDRVFQLLAPSVFPAKIELPKYSDRVDW